MSPTSYQTAPSRNAFNNSVQNFNSKIKHQTVIKILTKIVLSQCGGVAQDRTADLLHAMQALSQLSYNPKLVAVAGLEPATFGL